MAQGERGKRSNIDEDTGKRKAARYSAQNVLSGLLICAECGANYGRITKPSGEVVWRCGNKAEHGNQICKSAPTVSEECLKSILCKLLTMETFDEEKIKRSIESIFIQHNDNFEVEYKYEQMQIMEY